MRRTALILFLVLLISSPVFSAPIMIGGLETGDFSRWYDLDEAGSCVTTIESSSPIFDGSYSAQSVIAGDTPCYSGLYSFVGGTTDPLFARFFLFLDSGFVVDNDFFIPLVSLYSTSEGAPDYNVNVFLYLDSSLYPTIYSIADNSNDASSSALSTGKWYCVEVEVSVDNSSGYANLWIDDALVASFSGADTQPTTYTETDRAFTGPLLFGNGQTSSTMHFDNIIYSSERIGCSYAE